jgi:hypothetical protein
MASTFCENADFETWCFLASTGTFCDFAIIWILFWIRVFSGC